MAQHAPITRFYHHLFSQWGKAQGLHTISELICRRLAVDFAVEKTALIVAYKSHWKMLFSMQADDLSHHFPPIEIPDHIDIPFYQITKAIRRAEPYMDDIGETRRLWLPLERRAVIVGCLVIDLPKVVQNAPITSDHFKKLATLLAAELDASLVNETIQDEHAGRRTAERELQIRLDEQHSLFLQLQALHDISFKLWRATSMDNMFFTAVDEAKRVLCIDRLAIFLFKEQGRMQGTYGTDLEGNTVDERYFESAIPDMWFANHTVENKEYLVVEKNTQIIHDLKPLGILGWSAYLSLWDEDTPIGWIACDNLLTGAPIHDYQKHVLKQFGFIVSQHFVRRQAEEKLISLNAELEQRVAERTEALQCANEQLEIMSRLDPLTNVANRRVFDARFIEEWRRAERHQLPLSLLVIDVDHFKHYNDHYGHAAGDDCLREIAHALSSLERRAGALFARYGGEEFVLLLPGQDQCAARYTAKRAVDTIYRLQLPRKQGADSAPNVVTISVGGCTVIPSSHISPTQFFERTDGALYDAKSKGRNQFVIA
ncbi:diguanylate cyclase [Photobacterium japonica]|uniref:sensor domain-containing diguanylate cyclase n=1 Tax=Photobacterium japonica TaxID=2910235 RepID=UPI003D0D72BE